MTPWHPGFGKWIDPRADGTSSYDRHRARSGDGTGEATTTAWSDELIAHRITEANIAGTAGEPQTDLNWAEQALDLFDDPLFDARQASEFAQAMTQQALEIGVSPTVSAVSATPAACG